MDTADSIGQWRWRGLDTLLSLGVFALALLFQWIWAYPAPHPEMWQHLAEASGLRPPASPFPGLHRLLLYACFSWMPADTVLRVLPWLGRVAVALATMWIYTVFRDILPASLRLQIHMRRLGAQIGRVVAGVGALLFLCADPVWRAGQSYTPAAVFLLLVVGALALFFAFIRTHRLGWLYVAACALGLISAESVTALVVSALMAGGLVLAAALARAPHVPFWCPLEDRLVFDVTVRRLSFVWLLAFFCSAFATLWLFMRLGGEEAAGWNGGLLNLLFIFSKSGWEAVRGAITPIGWLFAPLVGLVPFILALRLLPRAWDEDKFLPYIVGVVYAVVLFVALTPFAPSPILWFWNWLRSESMVPSDTTLIFFLFFDVAAAVFALAVFGIDACCRNYRRIAVQKYPESILQTGPAQLADDLGRRRLWRKRIFWSLVALVVCLTIPSRHQGPERRMIRLLDDYAREMLVETEGCDTLFSEGVFDDCLEVEALRAGRTLNGLSLFSQDKPRDRIIRLRARETDEDEKLLADDAVTPLRTWLTANNPRMARVAVQLGFELWRRNKMPLPPMAGLVGRPGGLDEAAARRGIASAQALSRRVVAERRRQGDGETYDWTLRRTFTFLLYRLARMAQLRSQAADAAGRSEESVREAALADDLDRVNRRLMDLQERLNWIKRQNGGAITPREGLVIGLARADFALAGRFAEPLLKSDPDDPRANFAVGMKYCQEHQYTLAERHLLRCLVRMTNEVAVLNNLAMVEIRLQKFDLAEKYVRAALKLHPELPEVKDTLKQLERARPKPRPPATPATP